MTGGDASGQPLNHVCVNLAREDYESIVERLKARAIELKPGPESSFGARGYTPHSYYFSDPDGNIVEIRYYD